MRASVRWLAGEPAARAAALRGLDAGDARVLHESVPRRILRLEAPGEQVLLVKHYRVGSGIHPFRERARALLRRGPADREWRALVTLAGQRVPVPRPLALGVLPDGDRLLVMQHVSGQPLREALAGGRHARWQILSGLGASVAAFHACGYVHGDLHHGNVLATAGGPVLLDLQRVRKARSAAARIRDLAHLDHSLAAFLSTSDRVRVRAAALGITRPFDAAARAALRAVGRASDRRARVHAASRRRHALRDGRAYARVGLDGARGLRALALPETAVAAALAAHGAALAAADARVLENDARGALCTLEVGGHRLVSKEAHVRSVARAVADLWRGSPARRAWAAGHGLEVLGVGAAAPLGYLEWRRFGLPVRSIVLLEDLRPDEGAHRVLESAPPAARAAALDALLGLVLRLHRAGVDHGDLKASHVLLRPSARGFEPRLIDLEGVRFAARLSDRRRVRALAQLNASIGDALEAPARCRFFARYAQALRFEAGAQATRSEIVRESLARRHRWTGRGCAETP